MLALLIFHLTSAADLDFDGYTSLAGVVTGDWMGSLNMDCGVNVKTSGGDVQVGIKTKAKGMLR